MTRLTVGDPDAMHELGRRLGGRLRAGDLVILTGPLGAGKTTLTRGIGEGLGIRGPVTSPTFVLARTHPSLIEGPPLVHVDAYRLGSALELDDLDIDFAGSVVVAEWGEGLLDGVSDSVLEIVIERPSGAAADGGQPAQSAAAPDDEISEEPLEPRTLTFSTVGKRWEGADFAALDPAGSQLH